MATPTPMPMSREYRPSSSGLSSYSTASSTASTNNNVSSYAAPQFDPSLNLPSFDALNPFARLASASSTTRDVWQPVPDLVQSKETLHFRADVRRILRRVHEEISREELEVRANTPEFRVHEDDWVAHNANNMRVFAFPGKAVARLPDALLVLDDVRHRRGHENDLGGFLLKRGERNRSYKRRYMELCGSRLTYYKKKPEKHGIPLAAKDKKAYERGAIDLDRVSAIKPIDLVNEPFGIHLVTTARIWVLTVENQNRDEFETWVKALCSVVKFSAVDPVFRRMLLLEEVSSKDIAAVRMSIAPTDTVGEVVEHIFNCYKNALDAAPLRPYDPAEYVLKVTGLHDYMIDRFRAMNEYMHVRECLLTKKTLCLTVIPISVVHDTTARSIGTFVGIPRTDLLSNSASFDMERGSMQSTMLGEELDRVLTMPKATPSGSVQDPYALRIHRVLNIPRFTCVQLRSSEEVVIRQQPLTLSSVVVRVELFDAGEKLDHTELVTTDVRLRAQKNDMLCAEWDEPLWFQFNMDVCEIVKTMRIQLTLLGVKRVVGSKEIEGLEEKMLVTGINAFEVDGLLTQDMQYVSMFNNLHSCAQGPVPHVVLPEHPLIQVEFPRYGTPIQFDWTETNPRMSRRTIVYGSKSQQTTKTGWLQKVGFSRWTKWRRRWFVLNQEACTLGYGDEENAPKKIIPLRNCLVMPADDMNETYTTFAVNKGTRKMRQTWCFKVKPEGSSRDYIISAETKQEREEWMLAILAVSRGESAENIRVSRRSASEDNQDSIDDDTNGLSILKKVAAERRDSLYSSEASTMSSDTMVDELRNVILKDPLYRLGAAQKSEMWAHYELFEGIPLALPRILSCVDWTDREEIRTALELLPKWSIPDHAAAYTELLGGEFSNEHVRAFAVSKLAQMRDTTFSYFLPQFVQALKFEKHHTSALAMLLMERAIKNPTQIGFDLFWIMKVESYNPQYRELYGTFLNAFLTVCSRKMREILKWQDRLFAADGMFDRICQKIKAKKKDGPEEMKRVMVEELHALNKILPSSFQLPIDPRIEVRRVMVEKCRFMDSAKKPLWLVFENAEEGGNPVTVMFKAGDDVRQDCITLQLVRLMDEMWREEGLDLAMEPYRCVATSPMTGLLEIVPDSVTTADIHKRDGILGALKDACFAEWIEANNSDRRSQKNAVNLFMRSCAGYCVATCILGIGDRHNDNIMIAKNGRYFHIDFGHFLGHFKWGMGMQRERTPFVFTPEMAYVLHGTESPEFQQFVDTCCRAFNVVRRHMHLLVALLVLMIPAGMPELSKRDDINHLVQMLGPQLTDEEAAASFTDTIHFCLGNRFKRIDNTLHILKHALG